MGVQAIINREEPVQPADDLVPRARSGDLGAFEQLYRRHVGRVYALCLRMTAEPSRAEDQTQETFVRAWRKLGSFRGDSEFVAWLCRVAINVVLGDRRIRRRGQDKELPTGSLTRFERPGQTSAPGSILDLEQAITGLPTGARDVFVLHDVEGYRHREIARILDVAEGTSKAQLHRARKLLREALRS